MNDQRRLTKMLPRCECECGCDYALVLANRRTAEEGRCWSCRHEQHPGPRKPWPNKEEPK